jgi:Flp pilus assembly protein TadG
MITRLRFSLVAACAISRFRKDRKGSAAIEFSMIAAPFFMMIFAIIETASVFFATQVLETATQDTARLIMTGQAQISGMTAAQFKTNLCTRLSGLFDCGGVDVIVNSYPNFASIDLTNPVSGGVYTNPGATFNPGSAGNIVVVRTFYQWPLFVTGLGFNLADVSGNKRLIASTAAFRNEPGPF